MPKRASLSLPELDVGPSDGGQKSNGAMRSSAANRRSANRKSPYARPSPAPPKTTELSANLSRMGVASVTGARSPMGLGGVRGPIERQKQREARWKAQREAEEARELLLQPEPYDAAAAARRARQEAEDALGLDFSVDAWRDRAVKGFLGPGARSPSPRKKTGVGARGAVTSAEDDDAAVASSGGSWQPLPRGAELRVLPPLGRRTAGAARGTVTAQVERRHRRVRQGEEAAHQREAATRHAREAAFAAPRRKARTSP